MKEHLYNKFILAKGLLEGIKHKAVNWKEPNEVDEDYLEYLDREFSEIYVRSKQAIRALTDLYEKVDKEDATE